MNKIRIIDLLNKIAKGEETPKYIRYFNKVQREWLVMLVCKENIITRLNENAIFLNDEVEIIEEEKEIEKLEPLKKDWMTLDDIKFTFSNSEMILVNKINELVDTINELKRGN